jgi:DNA (cytosine-5)-methyltransferase 1
MLKIRTLFSGIGAPEKAFKNLGIDFETVDFCEIDKYAETSYCAIHNESKDKNLGDITKVWGRWLPYADMMVFGFPCQPFSIAGRQLGLLDKRGNMFFEALRILEETKPKIFMFENVPGLLSNDGGKTIEIILTELGKLNYEITMDLLNAKDFNIPQNRLRLFCIGRRLD